MRSLTLLLLSGGGHTGTNIMASLAPRRAGLRLVATSDSPDEPALFSFDAVYLAPKLARDVTAFEQRVLEIVAREKPDLVVPCRDEDVEWLAGLRERRRDLSGTFLCGARAMAVMMNDKWLSFEFSQKHGLPFAPSLPCIDSDDAQARVDAFVRQHGFPLVAKPRHGVDSKGIVILTTPAQALHAMKRPDYLLQEYLGEPEALQDYLTQMEQSGIPLFHTFQGVKRSLQVLIGPGGDIEHVVCTRNQMIRHNARSVSLDVETEPRRIGEQCARVFADAGWRGPLNIQCQPSSTGTLMIHEFNARFTGASGARWHIGHDEIGAAIRAFTGHAIAPAFPWAEAPMAALEGLWPRAADRRSARTLAERGEWNRGNG
jgi:carbamoylphosphate synthase large subunit